MSDIFGVGSLASPVTGMLYIPVNLWPAIALFFIGTVFGLLVGRITAFHEIRAYIDEVFDGKRE